MISLTTQLITQLLGPVLTSWLSCEPVEVLIGVFVFGYIVSILVRLLKS